MRIQPLCLLLAVGVSTLVTATPNCIIGCQCDEHDPSKLIIQECDSPLILTKDALSNISKKLTKIKISNVVIDRIDADAFSGFNDLEDVVIEDANIESIHPQAFDLPVLETIRFTKTTFGESPRLDSKYLEELIFDDCKLSQVPNLESLPGLSFLNLANNLIEEIDESAFSKVESLEEVTLTNNSISHIPPNLFSKHEDFTVLNLNNNPLTSFMLNVTNSLEFLSLKNCKLQLFDRTVTENLATVTLLDLSGNELSVLAIDVFEPMKELSNLDLSNNKLMELDDEIFSENKELDKIILDNNPFETLPKFQSVFSIQTFSCKNCSLTSVAGSFASMKNLGSVDLSYNNLENIDGVFTELNYLKRVFLSHNQIATIGIDSFGTNSGLEILDLSNNPLLPLDPVVFASMKQLKALNVSECNLKQLWANHNAELPALQQLFVDNNQLPAVTVDDVKIIPNLKMIDISSNPLLCQDDLQNFIEYVMKSHISPKSVQTHEDLKSSDVLQSDFQVTWPMVVPSTCDLIYFEEEFGLDSDDTEDNDLYDEDEPEDDYDMEQEEPSIEASVLSTSGFNLAKASYILSITSVFILTALLVLFVAVLITLLILKKNKSFNNGNLPRLKIPLWYTTPGHKKHSGSVYRPLSEEVSATRTPMINRYEFNQTPQVHNSV